MKTKLLLFLLFFTACSTLQDVGQANYTYKVQEVKKGNHGTKLHQRYIWPVKLQDMTIRGHLYGGIRYDIGPDQTDINKFAGFYGKKFRPHVRTSMQGYYYDIDRDQTVWTFYHHGISNKSKYRAVGHVPGYVNLRNVIYTTPGEVPDYHIDFVGRQEVRLAMTYKEQIIYDTIYFAQNIDKRISLTNLYVGGNIPAQEDTKSAKAIIGYSFENIKN